MKLNFRQGIARHQKDVNGNPTFLQKSAGAGNFIDLVVSPDPTVLVFAHRNGTYVVEEPKTVIHAWGPIIGTTTKYLWWDINLLTGALTRGLTELPPIYTSASPVSPAVDQHWFDTTENVFKVWNGNKWVEKIRLFAGTITSGAILHPAQIGSQAGLVGSFEGGNILLDSFGNPLRQSDGCFVTTVSWLNVNNFGTVTARLDAIVMSGLAAEELPKYSLVTLQPGRRMVLARSTDYRTRVAGLVLEDLYEGEVSNIITVGIVKNNAWNWPAEAINRPFFCGPTGQITLTPPSQGVLQQCGFIYDTDSIYMQIHQVVVLDNPDTVPAPPPPPPVSAPIANFTALPLSGVAPLVVNFTDTSTGATSVEWDFTNDGFVEDTTLNPSYTYATPGTYTVRHRAINSFGMDDEIKVGYISVTAPSTGPGNVNLGLSFGAPVQVASGSTFSFQVIVTNDGSGNATNVLRQLTLRSNNGSIVTIVSPPPGVTVTTSGQLTNVTLPLVNILSGGSAVMVLQATVAATAKNIMISGNATSPETDPTPGDNNTSITIGVKKP